MVNQTAINPLRGKSFLTALVFALLIYVQLLGGQGVLHLLSPERRIVLIIVALRLFSMVLTSLMEDVEHEKLPTKYRYTGRQAGMLPFAFMTPLWIVLWSAWWLTGGLLPRINNYVVVINIIMLVLVVSLAFQLAKSLRGAADSVHHKQSHKKFWTDFLFYGLYGLVFSLVMVGFMVLSPESLDDIKTIGQITFSVYILLLVVQIVFAWFGRNKNLTGNLRQDSLEPIPGQRT